MGLDKCSSIDIFLQKASYFVTRIVGRRCVVFEPMTTNISARLEPVDIERMIGSGVDHQLDLGAIGMR